MLLLLRILNKLNVLGHLNLSVPRTINGVRFSIPLRGTTGLELFYEKEVWMTVIMRRLLPLTREQTFIDVGVNVGQTLLTLKSLSNGTEYTGFEPNPLCVEFVSGLIDRNKLNNVQIVPAALSDRDGIAILYKDISQPADSSATLVEQFRETHDKIQVIVPVVSAKNVTFLDAKTIGIVKIDVEGGELEVITALTSILERDKPFVICEILPVYTADNIFRGERQQRLLDIMTKLRYQLFRIGADGTLSKLETIGIHDKVEDSNYLFVPNEKVPQL
jgi:FkbM family methyltransferase